MVQASYQRSIVSERTDRHPSKNDERRKPSYRRELAEVYSIAP